MAQPTAVMQDSHPLADGPISRRMLLAGSTGLIAATGLAVRSALAQGTPTPGMPAVQAPVRQDWLDKRHEEIIEPELPIIDPHHHLWDRPNYRYLFPELLADVGSGHNIRVTCYEQAREMYRTSGPEELKSLGETEFVSGVAAMSESGKYGPTRCIAGIIGFVDLQLGSRAKGVLERHIAVSDGRLRGIRNGSTWSDDPILKTFTAAAPKGLLLDRSFREGFAALAPLGLAFDGWKLWAGPSIVPPGLLINCIESAPGWLEIPWFLGARRGSEEERLAVPAGTPPVSSRMPIGREWLSRV